MVLSPRNKVVDEIVDSRLLSSMTRLSRAVLPVSHPHCQDSDATAGEALYSADFDGHTVKFDRSPESGNPCPRSLPRSSGRPGESRGQVQEGTTPEARPVRRRDLSQGNGGSPP